MAKQQFNRRLSSEAIAAINWWAKQDSTPARKVTDTEIVERAIAMYDTHRAPGGKVTGQSGLPLERSIAMSEPAMPAVQQPVPLESSGHLPCRHCGAVGQIHPKTSPWRACPGCQRDGHLNFADCAKCARRDHAKGLAAKSTAADTSDIDFDPYNPA